MVKGFEYQCVSKRLKVEIYWLSVILVSDMKHPVRDSSFIGQGEAFTGFISTPGLILFKPEKMRQGRMK